MGIDDLRKKNSIPEPPSSREGSGTGHVPTLQSAAHNGAGVSADEEDLLEKIRTEKTEPQNCSGTERGREGTVPGTFGQGQVTARGEEVTGTAPGSGASTRIPTERTHNNGINQETGGTGPGVFGQDIERGNSSVNVYTQRYDRDEDDSTRSLFDSITSFFRILPELWQVDAVCIALTVAGLIAIILNLSAVLAFIFGILYAVVSLVFTVIFYIALIVGAIVLLFRRGRRRW